MSTPEKTLHIYTRVSSDPQAQEGTSLSAQQKLGIQTAKSRGLDYQIWEEGAASSHNEGFSGRPQFLELLGRVKGEGGNLGANQIFVKVDLTGDLDIIVDAFERYLKTKDVSDTYESNARFQPSRPMKNIAIGTQDTRSYKRDGKSENKLKTYRETYLLTRSMSYKEVALKLGWLEGDRDWYLTEYPNPDGTKGLLLFEYQKLLDNRVKKVKRHVDQVEKTFESIENGTFP